MALDCSTRRSPVWSLRTVALTSPLAALIALQVLLMVLTYVQAGGLRMIASAGVL